VAEPPEGSKPSEYERPMYPPALGAPPLNGDSGESLTGLLAVGTLILTPSIGRSPYPPPSGLRGQEERERGGERERERERDRPAGNNDRALSRQVPASPPTLLSDLDPENVSRELKKEGSDWVAVWSSQSKKMLDVSLVHTLNHET
jgi:glucose repression regulatory protein TUP1